MYKKIVLSVALLFGNSSIFAKSIAKVTDVEDKYTGKRSVQVTEALKQSLNLGFSNTSGNTDTLNMNGKYSLAMTSSGYQDRELKTLLDLTAFYTENGSVKSNEEFTLKLAIEQFVSNDWLGYLFLNWLQNKFKNYDNKYSVGMGIGREVYHDSRQSLKMKIGVADNVADYTNEQRDSSFISINEYFEYNNKINKVSKFYVKFGSLQNYDKFDKDYEAIVVAGLNFSVAENISVTIEEEISYDKKPAVGFDTTDTKSIVRVGYNF